jgi:hypothetical protein
LIINTPAFGNTVSWSINSCSAPIMGRNTYIVSLSLAPSRSICKSIL